MSTKVFISHASDDKDRFVRGFATKLRTDHGIDAWLDEWEITPGDSLVGKIFNGIENAEVVIIVLSRFSTDELKKPWVREELEVGIVRRIQDGIKIIPVLIDDCIVPTALKALLYQEIKDLENYDVELERIVAAILNRLKKPPLGSEPTHVPS